ncbi:MAG: hypothetical protein JWM23_1173 [Microbacteriaceae bacterium]|nr:hypothetical protein [Microbacteriaceae bacterium]
MNAWFEFLIRHVHAAVEAFQSGTTEYYTDNTDILTEDDVESDDFIVVAVQRPANISTRAGVETLRTTIAAEALKAIANLTEPVPSPYVS